ncbi:MAG TPA: glycosyltransferase family 2 protein [Gemmatimonadaceae bacterium]|nr:glycosyltransferase family 2 protein [Gemmatimonadaceae bacterium]
MIHVCIPVYNEAPTIGVLLWRIRQVFQDFPREYEVLVYDDGSDDATAETLEPYARVLPLTVVRGEAHRGYAQALDTLLRTAARRTRYPRRDAAVVMQADFTDQPEHLPELVKRFEGGADVVVAELARPLAPTAPTAVRRLRWVAPWVLRPFVAVPGVRDPFGAFRLFRISVLRDLVREAGDRPLVSVDGWAGNVELLVHAARLARRVETVELAPRYDLRPRASRVRPWPDALNLYRFGRAARARPAASPSPVGTPS